VVFKDNSSAEDTERMRKINREVGLADSTSEPGNEEKKVEV